MISDRVGHPTQIKFVPLSSNDGVAICDFCPPFESLSRDLERRIAPCRNSCRSTLNYLLVADFLIATTPPLFYWNEQHKFLVARESW